VEKLWETTKRLAENRGCPELDFKGTRPEIRVQNCASATSPTVHNFLLPS
jgi:hypothetical protein